jgi:hypothetical protein
MEPSKRGGFEVPKDQAANPIGTSNPKAAPELYISQCPFDPEGRMTAGAPLRTAESGHWAAVAGVQIAEPKGLSRQIAYVSGVK